MKKGFLISKDKVALLVIDMQKYFCDRSSVSCVPKSDITINKIKNLINVFNENNRPIIFTRHIDSDDKNNMMLKWWRENIKEEDPMSGIIEDFDTGRGEVIVKHQYDAFLNTRLEKILKDKGVQQVVICGVLTNLCCETTARSAFMKGFEVYFTTDATATYKKEMHEATLLNLSYGFAIVVTVDNVIKALKTN